MTHKLLKSAIILLVIFCTAIPAIAKDFGIVAVVNSEVITNYALQKRISLSLGAAGIKDTPSARAKLALQTLENLIDETLQSQEAKKRNIEIAEEDIQRAKASLATQNNFKPEDFDQFLKKHSIDSESFMIQIRSQIIWQKILMKLVQPRIYVSKEEAQEFIDRLMNNKDTDELLLAEILIPVMLPEQEEDAEKLATQLSEELKNGGDFAKIARQFSRSNSAENGGEVGWIRTSDLETKVRDSLVRLEKDQVSEVIRTSSGFLIMKVNDRRSGGMKETPDEGKVREFLARQKLELEARKFMKDLRRAAYIERRI